MEVFSGHSEDVGKVCHGLANYIKKKKSYTEHGEAHGDLLSNAKNNTKPVGKRRGDPAFVFDKQRGPDPCDSLHQSEIAYVRGPWLCAYTKPVLFTKARFQ